MTASGQKRTFLFRLAALPTCKVEYVSHAYQVEMLGAEFPFPVVLPICLTAGTLPFDNPHTCGSRIRGQEPGVCQGDLQAADYGWGRGGVGGVDI